MWVRGIGFLWVCECFGVREIKKGGGSWGVMDFTRTVELAK